MWTQVGKDPRPRSTRYKPRGATILFPFPGAEHYLPDIERMRGHTLATRTDGRMCQTLSQVTLSGGATVYIYRQWCTDPAAFFDRTPFDESHVATDLSDLRLAFPIVDQLQPPQVP